MCLGERERGWREEEDGKRKEKREKRMEREKRKERVKEKEGKGRRNKGSLHDRTVRKQKRGP